MERNDRFYRPAPSRLPISLPRSRFLDVTQRSPFFTENTESDTFWIEEYSEKYAIVVWKSLLR